MNKITHKVRCEQWTSIIKECLASGMPKTTWCREHGISDKSFFYWQRILREEAYLTTLERARLGRRWILAFIRIELLFEIISWKAQKLRLSKKSSRIMISY